MKKILTAAFLLSYATAIAQTPANIIKAVQNAQQHLKWATYTLTRTDTLLTGDIRQMKGNVTLSPDTANKVFGYQFKAQLDGTTTDVVYDGHLGYHIDTKNKAYTTTSGINNLKYMLNGGGGWLIMPDLIRLDTSGSVGVELSQSEQYYYLKLKYADYLPESVTKRYKIISINKTTMLPVAVRNHSQTNGRVQDLYWHIDEIKLNAVASRYDFSLPFLKDFKQTINGPAAPPAVFSLKDKSAPNFELTGFNGQNVSLSSYKSKVIVLDFWELWCGPCIAGMPKVQQLYDNFKSKGLQVLGIMNDAKQLTPAKQMLSTKKYSFAMLLGNEQLRKDYKFDGMVPLYMVINKAGKIAFVGGFDEVEPAVIKALGD